jgi:hypothetical protein
MRAGQEVLRSTRGSTMVLVAVSLVAIMASMAMAIDLGMLYKNRSDAQRVADAASLAGAAVYLEATPLVTKARDNAVEYILKNSVGNDVVDPVTDSASLMQGADLVFESREATIRVMPTAQKVRVQIRRAENETWFARLFGKDVMPVRAQAAAEAVNTGTARCLKPFALPDMWDDPAADVNGNRIWDEGEDWGYGDDGTDRYERFQPGDNDATGLGGGWRNGNGQNITDDYGRQTVLKYQGNLTPPGQSGDDPINLPPSFYLTWRLPNDPDVMQCNDPTAAADGNGEAALLANVCHCNTSPITLFDSTSYFTKPGIAANPLDKAINQLVSEDDGARWENGTVVGSSYGDGWISSPRVVKVALFSPDQLQDTQILNGNKNIVFNNFGLLFLEKPTSEPRGGEKGNITGRFLRYVGGDENLGPAAGPLVKYIKLVE